MSSAIMIQGTGSHVGKSTLVAALCRTLHQDGFRVSPFKSQNMSLNAFVTFSGDEIGRAQALQAMAAGVQPCVEMNPILLKATSDSGAQVILRGKPVGVMRATEYQRYKSQAWRTVIDSYHCLSERFDRIVIEGAGSPAEINLKEHDISNMRVARLANAPVLLVGDIDRGGVFASLLGTLQLLTRSERARVAGFIINKFRGEEALLQDGLRFLERKTGLPVLGVLPYLPDLFLDEEDGVALDASPSLRGNGMEESVSPGRNGAETGGPIRIAVVHLPHISNFTDFDPLARDPRVKLRITRSAREVTLSDVVILPGTKNTIGDLRALRKMRLDRAVLQAHAAGRRIIGICGGFQMLGTRIRDPLGVEDRAGAIQGLGLLGVETTLAPAKITDQVEADCRISGRWPKSKCKGYEIHMGRTRRYPGVAAAFRISRRGGRRVGEREGAVSPDARVWGTYLHGLFENDSFRDSFLAAIQGGQASPKRRRMRFGSTRLRALDRLADSARKHLDLKRIYELF